MTRTLYQSPRYEPGSFGLSHHLEMLSDRERVDRAKKAIMLAIESCGPNSVFCELGCGTGFFSIFAARYCKKVYAVESDPLVLEVASRNIDRLGLNRKIVLIAGDARKVPIPSVPIDVLFCEMMSIWLILEPQVPVVRRWLRDSIHPIRYVIPSRVINLAELGQVDYVFDELSIKVALPSFSGIRPPRLMTESRVMHEVLLSDPASLTRNVTTRSHFKALVRGVLNCARLSSIVEFFPGVIFSGTDTLMSSTIVPLEMDLSVEAGDQVLLESSYKHRSDLTQASFRASKL